MTHEISRIVNKYGYSVFWGIDWVEPIITTLPSTVLLCNIADTSESNNCEMLLLPDGWYFNGRANTIPARTRMQVLEDVAEYVIDQGYPIEFFLGDSGTLANEYKHVHIDCHQLSDFLCNRLEEIDMDFSLRVTIMD